MAPRMVRCSFVKMIKGGTSENSLGNHRGFEFLTGFSGFFSLLVPSGTFDVVHSKRNTKRKNDWIFGTKLTKNILTVCPSGADSAGPSTSAANQPKAGSQSSKTKTDFSDVSDEDDEDVSLFLSS